MSVLAEVQPRVHGLTGGLFANWIPSDQVDVGDYGVIARERFVRDGNLRHFRLAFEVETPEKSKGKLEYSDRAKFSAKLAAKGAVRVPGHPTPKASAEIAFSGKGHSSIISPVSRPVALRIRVPSLKNLLANGLRERSPLKRMRSSLTKYGWPIRLPL